MRVSVVVSTFQRAELLAQLVRALEAQTLPREDFEVVILDNGSTDRTPAVLAELASGSPLRFRILRNDRNRGPAAGRNLAWRSSAGAIVAFTDDDCVPTPGWLEHGLKAMGTERRIVVGRTIPNPDQEDRRGPFSMTIHVEQVLYFETCNIFYRRTDLEAAGGFVERAGHTGAEDADLGWRIRDDGAEAVFAAEALVYHDIHASNLKAAVRRAHRWSGIAWALSRHPDARRLLVGGLFWKPSHPLALGVIAGALLAPRRPLALTLALPWLAYRVAVKPLSPLPRRRWLVLPGALAIDLAEVSAMIRGSVEYRTIVL